MKTHLVLEPFKRGRFIRSGCLNHRNTVLYQGFEDMAKTSVSYLLFFLSGFLTRDLQSAYVHRGELRMVQFRTSGSLAT